MKMLLLTQQYPKHSNKYRNGFVHSRVKAYVSKGYDVEVLVYDRKIKEAVLYEYEGVKVKEVNSYDLAKVIETSAYNIICIHFALRRMTEIVLKHKSPDMKIIVWVHGYEALNFKRRTFNLSFETLRDYIYIPLDYFSNLKQLIFFRKLITNQNEFNTHFVFVSEWMKKVTETDTKTVGSIKNYSIIPNPINTEIFSYEKKTEKDRLKIFNLRPYGRSKKYANDITIKVIKKLSEEPFFENLVFNLYGNGERFEEITNEVKEFSNVNLYKGFLNQREIKEAHNQNGILLMPTRQDAQGVSMCEAICSGLVPIVSNNTAIPEFADEEFGYLCSNVKDYAEAIKELYYNSSSFLEKSKNTKKLANRISNNVIINEELDLIDKLII